MNGDTFDDLVANCVISGFKHRMLYVFVRVESMDEETRREMFGDDANAAAAEDAGFVQIIFDAHQPVNVGLTFDSVRDTADAQDPSWNMVVVTVAKNSDASLPTDEQANAILANMRERIMSGDVADFAILDRDGTPVGVEAEVLPNEIGPAH